MSTDRSNAAQRQYTSQCHDKLTGGRRHESNDAHNFGKVSDAFFQRHLNLNVNPSAHRTSHKKGKGSPYSITERRVLIPVLGSQPAGDVSYKPGGRLPLLSARPAVTRASSFAA